MATNEKKLEISPLETNCHKRMVGTVYKAEIETKHIEIKQGRKTKTF